MLSLSIRVGGSIVLKVSITNPNSANGKLVAMMVSIDKAGRVVVPKDIRDRLDFAPGSQLELRVEGDTLVLSPQRTRGRRVVDVDGFPAIQPVSGMSLSDADVQKWRDDGQR